MNSLHKYAARRNKVFYYSPEFDPTIPTGEPLPEPIPSPEKLAQSELRDVSAPIEDQINEPMGFVEEVAREYARLRSERGPKTDASAPVLDERELRRKRKEEEAKDVERRRAISLVQYQKLLDQRDYVNAVYKEMEERGYFGEPLHDGCEDQAYEELDEDYSERPSGGDCGEGPYYERDEFVQGSSKGATR